MPGILLYRTLFEQGLADRPESVAADDGLVLTGCRITNAVRCLPPANKPLPVEVRACNGYLAWELKRVPSGGAVLALGAVAHGAVLRALGLQAVVGPLCPWGNPHVAGRAAAGRFLSLQPLQHPDPQADAGDVCRSGGHGPRMGAALSHRARVQ